MRGEVSGQVADHDIEFPDCPLCKGNQFKIMIKRAQDRVARKAGSFQVQQCEACGLVITRPRPSAKRLPFFYEGVYSGAGAATARAAQTGAIGQLVARYRLRVVRKLCVLSPRTRLLDIGCGYGVFAALVQREAGCEVTGMDIDEGCLKEAMGSDVVDYRLGSLELLAGEPGRYDVVTFFESLEHHADPVQALKMVRGLLKPGGVCVIEVPNFNGFWRKVFGTWWLPLLVPQHQVHFTPETLERTLRHAGFDVLKSSRPMFYPFESTASFALWLNDKLGRPLIRYRLRWSRPDGVLLLLAVAVWWLLVEIPVQVLLMPVRGTGHQLIGSTRKHGEL
ncbi:MAG: class I SAM-dependent methyltransferase [Pseudomonadota bacterium]